MKVALAHDWLIHMRGGEKVLEAISEVYPNATIYTLFYDRSRLSPSLQKMKIIPSFLHYLPGIKKYYRYLLPILPLVIKTMIVREEVDVIISSSHCVAKGIRIPRTALHLCYCHTPMRYLWGFEKDYFPNVPFFLKPILKLLKAYLRRFDLKTNKSVHFFIANSLYIRDRIQRNYQRDSKVIYPPLNTSLFSAEALSQGLKDYYLVVSAFVPYKRVDVVIQAFNKLDRNLYIVGSGPMEKSYLNLRKSSKITFLGAVSDARLKELYREAKALIFPTEEDFGIVPLEAQACGAPVIAYGKGGALESVKTGHFFYEQSSDAICQAVEAFESQVTDRSQIAHAVEAFSKERFQNQIREYCERSKKLT